MAACGYTRAELLADARLTEERKEAEATFFICKECRVKVSQHGAAAPAAASAAAAGAVLEQILVEQRETRAQVSGMKRALEAKEIPSFSMSSAGSEKNWTVIQQAFKLDFTPVWSAEFDAQLRTGVSDDELDKLRPAPFRWEADRTEANHKEEYLSYLRDFVVMPRKLALALAPNNLLDLENGSFGFKLTGTSDIVIVDSDVQRNAAGELSSGSTVSAAALLATIEIKKKVTERDVRQAAAELISADIHAQMLQPFAVVTDLQDDWRFLWLRGQRTIMTLSVPTVQQSGGDASAPRRAASLLLRRLLAEGSSVAADRLAASALLEALPIPIGKRQKLSPVKERPHGREESDACAASALDDSDSDDVDGPGWDDVDRKRVLLRQVRVAMRHTPWMHDMFRRPARFDKPPMSADAINMFG